MKIKIITDKDTIYKGFLDMDSDQEHILEAIKEEYEEVKNDLKSKSFEESFPSVNIERAEDFCTNVIPKIIECITDVLNNNLNKEPYNKMLGFTIREMKFILDKLFSEDDYIDKKQEEYDKIFEETKKIPCIPHKYRSKEYYIRDMFKIFSDKMKEDNTYNIFYEDDITYYEIMELLAPGIEGELAYVLLDYIPRDKDDKSTIKYMLSTVFIRERLAKTIESISSTVEGFTMEYFLLTFVHELSHVIQKTEDDSYQNTELLMIPSEKTNVVRKKSFNIYDVTRLDNYESSLHNAESYAVAIFAFALLLHRERVIDLTKY